MRLNEIRQIIKHVIVEAKKKKKIAPKPTAKKKKLPAKKGKVPPKVKLKPKDKKDIKKEGLENKLRKIIRESIEEVMNEEGPVMERDDVGNFYVVKHPEKLGPIEEIFFESSLLDYPQKSQGGRVAAVVKSPEKAKKLAHKLMTGKKKQMSEQHVASVEAKRKKIEELRALDEAIAHYCELKKLDPKNPGGKLKQYKEQLRLAEKELGELEKAGSALAETEIQ